MIELKGIQASPGIAIGPVFLHDPADFWVDYRRVEGRDIPFEVQRLRDALSEVAEDLKITRAHVEEKLGKDHAQIFDAHLLILEDVALVDPTIALIKDERYNAEYAFWLTFQKLRRQFEAIRDDFFRERSADLLSIEKRVLAKLCHREPTDLERLPHQAIVVARDLTPSDTAHLQKERVLGIVTEVGGATSHTAIIARGLEIPAVVGVGSVLVHVKPGDMAIVDGRRGRVVLKPDAETLARYTDESKRLLARRAGLVVSKDLPAQTSDGVRVELQGNIELPAEIASAMAYGAEGIGLYRTEYLYLASTSLPDEQTQTATYTHLAEKMAPYPLVIRTLDLGGDKLSHVLHYLPETNPFLGWRAIRLSLSLPDLFRVQLRAILRASAVGNVKIMFPLVSTIEELRQAKTQLAQVREELRTEGIPFDENCPVGVMIEVPSAAILADQLAREADFFSIGTNDLIQYTLAVDRGNENVAYLFDPFNPAVLRLIKRVIDEGHAHHIPVTVCGEMAGDPYASLLLLGLGIDGLSMTPRSLPDIKGIIRTVSFKTAQKIAQEVLAFDSNEAIRTHLQVSTRKALGEVANELLDSVNGT